MSLLGTPKTNCLVQLFLVCVGIGLIIKCITEDISYFQWHPVLMLAGWIVFILQGVLAFYRHNIITRSFSFKSKLLFHCLVQLAGVICVTTGFVIIYTHKEFSEKSHFTSWHGLFGLLTMIATVLVSLGGVATLFRQNLKSLAEPSIFRVVHSLAAFGTLLLASTTFVLGIFTEWFDSHYCFLAQMLCTVIFTSVYDFTFVLIVKKVKA